MRSRSITHVFLTMVPIVFLGCAGAPGVTPRSVDVGGTGLWVEQSGSGSPAVVFESGLGDDATWWRRVAPQVAARTTTVVYSRAGLGRSTEAPVLPRTSQAMAEDLHEILGTLEIERPFILVAHSIGALTARVYAAAYPGELAGIVLVDGSVPDQWTASLDALPAASAGEAPGIARFRATMTSLWSDPSFNPEHMDIAASAAEAKTHDTLGDLPLAIVTRSPNAHSNPMLPREIESVVEDVWQALQRDLLLLSTRSYQVVAGKAGHRIPTEEPKLVADVILRMLAEVQSASP